MKALLYLKSMKWRYYPVMVQAFLGYLLVKWPPNLNDFLIMSLLFLIFGPLIYGGLYSINDIIDVENDRKHPKKKHRPLASGKISVRGLSIFALILISLGLIIAYNLSTAVFTIGLVFIVINLLYSTIFKKVPYLDILANGITHPLRFYVGMVAAGSTEYTLLVIPVFLFAFSYATIRRKDEMLEKQQEARKVLKKYGIKRMNLLLVISLLVLVIFTFFQTGISLTVSLLFLALDIFIIVGYHHFRYVRKALNKIY